MAPVFSLLVLAPLIAEYLLGNLSFSQMKLFPLMVIFYGAGAVFVREVTRRTGRGWPTVFMLGLAYGIIEEALATQSLFNPNYMGAHMLDFGFIPALGIAAPWTVYVLGLHAVWSITVPIAFVEILFPRRRNTPWLGKTGLSVIGLIYALGIAAVTVATRHMQHFFASWTQLGVSVGIIAAVASAAFLLFPPVVAAPDAASGEDARGWRPWTLGLVAFVCGSAFHGMMHFGSGSLSPLLVVALQLVPILIALAVAVTARKSPNWTVAHGDALAVGALLVYCWWGFYLTYRIHGPGSLWGQSFPTAVILILLAARYFRPMANRTA